MKKLIYLFKYKPFISDLIDLLSNLFYESLIQQESFVKIISGSPSAGGFCVPIPLSSRKLRTRGYNQSQLIGKNLSKRFGWTLADFLERTRDTKPQFGLTKKERIENMEEAFRMKLDARESKLVKETGNWRIDKKNSTSNFKFHKQASSTNLQGSNYSVFIVDDLLTTGVTLREAASVLKRNGFKKVWGICLAGDCLN